MARQQGAPPTRRSSRVQQKEAAAAAIAPKAPAPAPATARQRKTSKSARPEETQKTRGRPQSARVSKTVPEPRGGNSSSKSKKTGRKGAGKPTKRGRPNKKPPVIEPSDEPGDGLGNNPEGEGPNDGPNDGPSEAPNENSNDDPGDDSNNDELADPRGISARFRRADIEAGGGLEFDHAKLPTLTNAVHPIWHFEHFIFPQGSNEQQNYESYAAILPALRLASLWITEPEFEIFWISIINPSDGQVFHETDPDIQDVHMEGAMHLTADTVDASQMEPEERTEALAEYWANHDETSGFWWIFRPLLIPPFAVTVDAQNHQILSGVMPTDDRVATILHDDLLYLNRFPHNNPTTSEQLRIQFFFAVILCRELVQNIYWTRWEEHTDTEDIEPSVGSSMRYKFDDANIVVHDVAWERFMFSGVIHQISPPPSPMAPDGLAVQLNQWSRPMVDQTDDEIFTVLSMAWINDQFSSSVWEAGLGHAPQKSVSHLQAREPAIVGGRDPFLPVTLEEPRDADSEEGSD